MLLDDITKYRPNLTLPEVEVIVKQSSKEVAIRIPEMTQEIRTEIEHRLKVGGQL